MISEKQEDSLSRSGLYVSGRVFSGIKYKAAKRKIDFNLELDYLDALFESQKGLCYYSGLPLDAKTRNQVTASLDRTDSNLGYVPGNVRWVHKDVNFMKHKASEARFFDLIEKIYERRNRIDQTG